MAVGEQDRGGVPVAPTVAFRCLDQLVDLTLGQVLARAGRSNCYIYYLRSTLLDVRIFHDFCPFLPDDCYDTWQKCNSTSTRMGLIGASILRPCSFCGPHTNPRKASFCDGHHIGPGPIPAMAATNKCSAQSDKSISPTLSTEGANANQGAL